MKFLIKALASVLAIVGEFHFVTNAATLTCQGMCDLEIARNKTCTEAMEYMYFGGDCCSLKEVDGNCRLRIGTNSYCYVQHKDADGSHYDEDLNVTTAVVPGTHIQSLPLDGVDEPCPESEFEIPTPETTDLDSVSNTSSEQEVSSHGANVGSNATSSSFAKNVTCPNGKPRLSIVMGKSCYLCMNEGFSNCSSSWNYPPLSFTYTPDGCGETFCPDGDEADEESFNSSAVHPLLPPENKTEVEIPSISVEHEADSNATSSAFDNNFTCPSGRNSKPTMVMGKSCHLCINEGFSNCSVSYSYSPLSAIYIPDGCGETICPDNHAASNSTFEQQVSSDGLDTGSNSTSPGLANNFACPSGGNSTSTIVMGKNCHLCLNEGFSNCSVSYSYLPLAVSYTPDGCGETICPDGDELPPPENNTEVETPSICVSLDTCLDCLSADCKWTGGSCQSMCLMDTSCFAIGEGEIPESVCPATIPDEDGWISPDTDLSPSSDPTSAPKSGETGSNTTSEHEVSSGGTDAANNATSELEISSTGVDSGSNDTSSAFAKNFTCPSGVNSKPTIVRGNICHFCINEGFSKCSTNWSYPPLSIVYTPDGCGETFCPDGDELSRSVPPPENDPKAKISSISDEHETDGNATSEQEGSSDGDYAGSNSTSDQEGSSNGADAGSNATSLDLPPPENNTEVETPSISVEQDTGSNTTSEHEVGSNSTDAVNNATSEPEISSDGEDASSNDVSLAFGKKAPFLLALGTILVAALPTFSASFI